MSNLYFFPEIEQLFLLNFPKQTMQIADGLKKGEPNRCGKALRGVVLYC